MCPNEAGSCAPLQPNLALVATYRERLAQVLAQIERAGGKPVRTGVGVGGAEIKAGVGGAGTTGDATGGFGQGAVRLELAVKTQPLDKALAAAWALQELGLPVIFGHNKVQELTAMVSAWPPGVPAVEWHLIGNLQSNKVNQVLATGALVETVDTWEIAQALAKRVEKHRDTPLPVYLQVNTSGEATKSGCAPADASQLAARLAQLPQLKLRGLMTIGAHTKDEAIVRQSFRDLAALGRQIFTPGPGEVTDQAGLAGGGVQGAGQAGGGYELSMGMSGDFEIAVACGASLVRLGSSIFGARN